MNRTVDIVIPVYNDNPYLEKTLESILSQQLPKNWKFHVYVVDDGSDTPVSLVTSLKKTSAISMVRLEKNQGCSVARNKGSSIGSGEVILFLDADCSLKHEQVLSLLLKQYNMEFDVCFGQINVDGDDFWAKYQRGVSSQRVINFIAGNKSSMTTAIFMIKREIFEFLCGFDESYHYGFEDRDFFITLIKNKAKMTLLEKPVVNHNDKLSLRSVTKKLFKSAQDSADRFIEKHPEEYRRMTYSKVDVRFSNGALDVLVVLTKPVLWPLIGITDWAIDKGIIPYFVAKNLVKYLSGLAYLHGTFVNKRS